MHWPKKVASHLWRNEVNCSAVPAWKFGGKGAPQAVAAQEEELVEVALWAGVAKAVNFLLGTVLNVVMGHMP